MKKQVMVLSLMLLVTLSIFAHAGIVFADKESESKEGHIKPISIDKGEGFEREKLKTLELEISPKEQKTGIGEWATYELKIKDKRSDEDKLRACVDDEGNLTDQCPLPPVIKPYEYKISVESGDGLDVELSQDTVTLEAGKEAEIKISAKSDKKGIYKFIVTAKGEDNEAKVRGFLIVGINGEILERNLTEVPIGINGAFFDGNGFALNEDRSKGHLVNLLVLKKGDNLRGKAKIGKRVFNAVGSISGDEVNLGLEQVGKKKSGNFLLTGKITKFDTFLLLEGNIMPVKIQALSENTSTEGVEKYSVTLISKRIPSLVSRYEGSRTIYYPNGKVSRIRGGLGKILVVPVKIKIDTNQENGSESVEDVYVKPVKIRKARLFRILPNPWGKKVLEMEVIKGDKVFKKKIKEGDSEEIEGHKVSVKDLSDESNIELDVE